MPNMYPTSEASLRGALRNPLRDAFVAEINPSSTDALTGNGGALMFQWQASNGEVWNPMESLILLEVSIQTAAPAAVAAGAATLYNLWPHRFVRNAIHKINGQDVGQSNQPQSDAERIWFMNSSYAASQNLGDLLAVDGTAFDGVRTTFVVGMRPPIPLWHSPKRIPGGDHNLTLNLSGVSTPATIASTVGTIATVQITSMRLYAHMERPQDAPTLGSQLFLPLYKITSQPETVTAGAQLTKSFVVPRSTTHVAVHFSATTDDQNYPVSLQACQVSDLLLRYNGRSHPFSRYNAIYDTATGSRMRAYYDTISAIGGFSDPSGVPLTFDQWVQRPFFLFPTPSEAGAGDTNAVIQVTCAAGCNVVVTAFSSAAIEMQFAGGRLTTAREILVV